MKTRIRTRRGGLGACLVMLSLLMCQPLAGEEVVPASLEARLKEMRERSSAKMPAEARKVVKASLDELVESRAVDRVLKAGARAPEFELPAATGEPLSSKEALSRGPLVISFYRGHW